MDSGGHGGQGVFYFLSASISISLKEFCKIVTNYFVNYILLFYICSRNNKITFLQILIIMATTIEELTALREKMAVAGLSTAEIDAKIETLKGEIAIENDYPSILESVQGLIEPLVSNWPYKNKNLTFRFDNKGLSLAFSELDGDNKIFYQREDVPEVQFRQERDTSRYRVNGAGPLNKKEMARTVVEQYVRVHASDDEMTVKRALMGLDVNITKFIRTKEEYDQEKMKSRDKNFGIRAVPVTWDKGILYVSTQWSVDRSDELMEKVNAQPWGIKIEKIQ